MVTYLPEQRLTIMRVFEGQAVAINREMPTYGMPVKAGEWALVEPGGKPPEVFDDPARMRRLAELGLWDVFHEVEVDVQQGFGPRSVPRGQVTVVFVTATPFVLLTDGDTQPDAAQHDNGAGAAAHPSGHGQTTGSRSLRPANNSDWDCGSTASPRLGISLRL